jgi:hypothetical protein
VTIQGSGTSFHPFGIDNVQFTEGSETPEPGAGLLTLTGALLFFARRFRRA